VSGFDSLSCFSLPLLALDLQGKLYLDLFFSGDLSFELSLASLGETDFIGGGGAGRFMEGLPSLGDPSCRFDVELGARVDWMLVSEHIESGERQTGSRSDLCSTSVCNIGLDISKFLKLLLSILDFLGNELYFPGFSFSLPAFLSATFNDGVLFTLEMSFEKLDLSATSGLTLSFFASVLALLGDGESSMRQTCACVATAGG